MKSFVQFMASRNGRITRIVIGALLILLGFFGNLNTALGYILMVLGVVFVAVGAFDVCLLAPLFGMPFQGKKIRGG
jgi:membrane-bound ClpP family serine protease